MQPRLAFSLCVLAGLGALLGLAAVLHQQAVQTFAAVDGLPDAELSPRPDGYAVNISLELIPDLDLVLARLTGFDWLRQRFAPEQTDWAEWDRIVMASARHGKRVIAVLAPADSRSPVPEPAAFADFAAAFASRYRGQIDHYQIWDEPNLSDGWAGGPPSAAAYAALLEAGYDAIHAADPSAVVIAAALAPTVETGPDNLSDLLYLQQLYDLDADRFFDAAAGKPYGFYTGPDDRQVDPTVLNFSRFALLRQVMERNGGGRKLLWGGNFGWNRIDSPWGRATEQQQIDYTLGAFHRARDEWPWAGPLALENYQPDASADDPRWGFALVDPAGTLTALGQAVTANPEPAGAWPGNHAIDHPSVGFTGDWELSGAGADIPEQYEEARVQITFRGTDFALRVRRGDYRAHLYVSVDGQPANRLPQDGRGAYLILTSPDLQPETATIHLASNLGAEGLHTVVIEPERGWDQWALVGFSVGRRLPPAAAPLWAGLLLVAGVAAVLGALHFGRRLAWGPIGQWAQSAWARLGEGGQTLLTALAAGLLYLAAWWTFDAHVTTFVRRLGDAVPMAVTALTAGLFYFAPSFLVALAALAGLFALFYLRLDLALAFTALFIPFYLFPRMLWSRGASMLEIALWLAFAAWLLRSTPHWLASLGRRLQSPGPLGRFSPSAMDGAMLALVIVALASAFAAARLDVALYEFRTVILGAALFYFLLRVVPLDRRAWWRVIDFFLLGATAVAVIGLIQVATGEGLITTGEGVARIRSVYGSPNNLALYLGRALPVALAVGLMGSGRQRRVGYAAAAAIMGAAMLLTFSRGALALGLPAAVAVLIVVWLGRRGWALVIGAVVLGAIALPYLAQLPRFAGLLDLESGTGFFRLRLWESAWQMFRDHPWLGVGPDNFLYEYRGRYILPDAWQEPNLSHPHNLALDFLTRVGLLGAAAGAALLLGFGRAALSGLRSAAEAGRDERALLAGGLAALAHMLAHGLVDHSFFLVDLAFAFSLLAALLQRADRAGLTPGG